MSELLRATEDGLYCEAGGFHVDPWRPVDRAVITHGHADHAAYGCRHYLTSERGVGVLRARLAEGADIQPQPFGQPVDLHGVRVSLHPAGHVLGSGQVRVEHDGEVWVVSGDYKTAADPTCDAFEPVRCDVFITEATFGLPVYRWRPDAQVFDQINAWWRENQAAGRTSVIYAYALGKAQRVLAGIDASIGPVLLHGAVERMTGVYREAGVALPETQHATRAAAAEAKGGALIVAPPSAHGTPWLRKFGEVSTAMASGWMRVRGSRRRRSLDRGFVLSDHVDWPSLLEAIEATGAARVGVTHGYTRAVSRYIAEQGRDSFIVPTRYEGEADADARQQTQAGEGSAAAEPTLLEGSEAEA